MLSIKEMAQVLGTVLGRKVRHVKMPMWMFYKAARMDGISPFLMSGLRYYVQEQARGTFAYGGPTNDVLDATGVEPETFETVARRHALRPESRQSLGNTLKALSKFTAVPFCRGFNASRYERLLEMPLPEIPLLDMDSARWKQEHSDQRLVQRSSLRAAI